MRHRCNIAYQWFQKMEVKSVKSYPIRRYRISGTPASRAQGLSLQRMRRAVAAEYALINASDTDARALKKPLNQYTR